MIVFDKKGLRPFIPWAALMVLVTGILSSGCAPTGQVDLLERRVIGLSNENRALKQELETLKQATQELQSREVGSVRQGQAQLANRVEEIQSELMRLSGLLEQMDHRMNQMEEENKLFREEIQQQLADLRGQIEQAESSEGAVSSGRDEQKVSKGGDLLYRKGMDLYKQGRYHDAKRAFAAFIQENPSSSKVPNAHFWIGECEYKLQRYEEAILEYQKVLSNYPKSNKVPDALLKQGLAFLKLGDSESARIVLKKLIRKYPRSPQASVARKQLARIS